MLALILAAGWLHVAAAVAPVPAVPDVPDAPRAAPDAPATPVAPPAPPTVVDGPSNPPVWLEFALPAGMPQLREVRTDTLFTVPRGTLLEVNNPSGVIAVQAWRRNAVRIVAEHARRDRLVPKVENGVLSVGVQDRRGGAAFGDITLLVPQWMPVRLASVESPINVEGVQAAIEAGSVFGHVVVRQSRGPVDIRSVAGGVHVADARGRVKVESIDNRVRIERVIGTIDAESVNGDIQLTEIESGDVEASTVNGGVRFDGPIRPKGRYRLVSHNGNLQVGIPVGTDVDVSVASFRGAFEPGFPVPAPPHGKGRRFSFTLGGGGSSLELESFQGLIQLLQLQQPPRAPRAPETPQAPRAPEAPQEGNR